MPPTLDYVKPASKKALKDGETESFRECLEDHIKITSASSNSDIEVKELDAGIVMVIDDFLSRSECLKMTKLVDTHPSLSFWSEAGRDDDKARSFRDADTIEVLSESIASTLWARMNGVFDKFTISIEEESDGSNDSVWERELPGDWMPVNFNHDLLWVKYPSGGAFSPHTDGKAIHDFNRRSFYSVIVFLNDVPTGQGGGTRFYKREALQHLQSSTNGDGRWTASEEYKTHEVPPRAGRLLVFDQRLVHEGVPPQCPYVKHIIRSDIMYQRVHPVCDSPEDIEAYAMFREADVLAEEGDVEHSLVLFRRAVKRSPALAKFMGQ
jgi:hypothetical protein